ncbi:MAG: hypothetical protein ACFE0Q_19355 [Anaerolineae bacterium]
MGITVDWLVEQRVLHAYAYDELTIEALQNSSEKARSYIRSGTPLVHDIFDMRHMTKYPIRLKEILSVTSFLKEEKLGWFIIVADSPTIRFLASVTVQFYGGRFRAFTDPEEAIAFLQDIDSTLPEFPAYTLPVVERS